MPLSDFTVEELLQKFHYCKETGKLYHRSGRFKGKPVGSISPEGYIVTNLGKNGKQSLILIHRIIYYIETGDIPELPYCIDHINHDREDNRFSNLRKVTYKDNSKNRAPRKTKDTPSRFLKTSVWGILMDKKTGIYYVMGGDKVIDKTYCFDQAKYSRWSWEFDNDFHQNNSIDP